MYIIKSNKINKTISILLCIIIIFIMIRGAGVRVSAESLWSELVESGTVAVVNNKVMSVDSAISGDIIIGGSVTGIADGAFSNCTEIRSVTIPDSVVDVGDNVFSGCSGLMKATIQNAIIGDGEFSNCTSLNEVIMTNALSRMGVEAFNGCASLTSITIPRSLHIIGEKSFVNCTALTSVTIENGVIGIGEESFSGCSKLASISMPDSLSSIGRRAFYNCSLLSAVYFGDGLKEIHDFAFEGCIKIASISIPEPTSYIGINPFKGCTSLTVIDIDEENSAYSDRNSNSIISNDTNKLISACEGTVIPETALTIGEYAFYGYSIRTINIPEGVKRIEANAFNSCSQLQSAIIPKSVGRIEAGAFALTNLNEITFKCIDSDSLSMASDAFTAPTTRQVTIYVSNMKKINASIAGYGWQRNKLTPTYAGDTNVVQSIESGTNAFMQYIDRNREYDSYHSTLRFNCYIFSK